MRDAVEREPTQLPAPAAPTEWPRSFRLPFCVYVVINFLCMFIYDFSCLNLVSVPSTIHFLDCHLALEFCVAYVGLITFGDICASPGVVFVRYAPYICALQVRYARYTRSPQRRSLLRFEFARHFESHLARPPPFYRRMRTTISDEHSIARTLRNARIIFLTYSFKGNPR